MKSPPKINNAQTKYTTIKPIIQNNGTIKFPDHNEFKPNLTPKQVLEMGSFGGTYFRPIYSSVLKKQLKDDYKEFPKSWYENLDVEKYITSSKYDKSINKYNVKCGQSLDAWEESGWISELDPYGWFQWYCRFYLGRRNLDEDTRQIKRFNNLTGPKGRFRNRLIGMIYNKNKEYNDFTISPVIRQVLQHWGYKLTKKDYLNRVKELNK